MFAAAEANAVLTQFGESDQDLAAARVTTRQFLVHLHGRIEVPESLMFADRHYRAAPTRDSYVEFFREVFVNRNAIFFGFSFADPVVSELITAMTRAVRSLFRREAYSLLAAPARPELVETLRSAGIIAIEYDPSGDHAAAWDLFAAFRVGAPPITAEQYEAQQVRSHLAAAYARAKSRQFRADRDQMLSALMLPLLAQIGSNTLIDLQEFLTKVEETRRCHGHSIAHT